MGQPKNKIIPAPFSLCSPALSPLCSLESYVLLFRAKRSKILERAMGNWPSLGSLKAYFLSQEDLPVFDGRRALYLTPFFMLGYSSQLPELKKHFSACLVPLCLPRWQASPHQWEDGKRQGPIPTSRITAPSGRAGGEWRCLWPLRALNALFATCPTGPPLLPHLTSYLSGLG